MFPPRDRLTICFAHVAYQLQDRFARRRTGLKSVEARNREELEQALADADVLVISGLWHNGLLDRAPKLRFIQSIGAGVDQFPQDELKERGIRLASARGVNQRAVAEHALALILALARRLPEARDNQKKRFWRQMISAVDQREDELAGKTLLIVGIGGIGGRLARLAKALDMRVIGIRRDAGAGANGADAVHALAELDRLLPEADIVALTCPLTPETTGVIGARALASMKKTAVLINVARGRCVDEAALIQALAERRIAAAGLDCFAEEPLPSTSPLWDFENVLVTPHTAGETQRYEENVLDVMLENLDRLWRGEATLKNQVV
ncbi:MAG TPA: D-2-hydroxyacid dehydrogenase [Alphaproteobacteria bacterium]|nr:D-2-hydroxyacid dehydrogenase [Alphaproteobacteria bacterium]